MTNIGFEHCASFVSSQFQPGGTAGLDTEVGVRRAVTISRQAGCGALAVAEKLARYLQEHSSKHVVPWKVFDRNLMEKVLEDHDLPTRLAQFLPEDRVSFLEDIMTDLLQTFPSSQTILRQTTETILKLASVGNVILKILGKPNVLPFGPWLSVASIMALFLGNPLICFYLSLLSP